MTLVKPSVSPYTTGKYTGTQQEKKDRSTLLANLHKQHGGSYVADMLRSGKL